MTTKLKYIKITEDYTFKCDNTMFEALAFALCLTPQQLEQNFIQMALYLKKAYQTVKELIQRIKNAQQKLSAFKRIAHKLNLNRPIIQHQVLDRKPKHLIKKIIH